VSVGTIRYYEKRRLLPNSPRSEGGYRLFAVETIERLRFIKQAQEIGFSLDEVRTLLSGGGVSACAEMRDLLQAKLLEINKRMKGLRAFARALSRHLGACEKELAKHGTAATCPVIVEIGRRKTKVRNEKAMCCNHLSGHPVAISADSSHAAQKRARSATASRKAHTPDLGSVAQLERLRTLKENTACCVDLTT
jgi:DNA-binding transcriptional MerR regulator